MRNRLQLGIVVGTLLLAPPVLAAEPTADALVSGARLCTQHFPIAEQRYGVPNHLLAAISSTESGRWHSGLGLAVPWPWTINVEGQGHYFASKEEAIAKTAAYVRAGRSVDVGCMQVNLRHHPNAFATLNDAFDPQKNVEYAAQFLRRNYDDLGNWVKATAAYHSRTPYYGSRYLGIIEKNWTRIVAKVQQARLRQGSPQLATTTPAFSQTRAELNAKAASTPVASTSSAARSVKVVKVRDAVAPKRPDVLVIHPQPTVINVADAAGTASSPNVVPIASPTSTADPVKRIMIDNQGRASDVTNNSGAKFVFAN